MSNIDSVIVIFIPSNPELDGTPTAFGFADENEANAWIRLQFDSANGLRGKFHLDWVTQPFTPEPDSHFAIDANVRRMEVGEPDATVVIDRRVCDNVMRLKSVKRITHGLTMKMEIGMLKTGVFGYTWQGMDRTTRILLMRTWR